MRVFSTQPINKPIKLKGLSPLQFFGAIICCGFMSLFLPMFGLPFYITVGLVSITLFFIFRYGSKVNALYKSGNPDPVGSLNRFRIIHKTYIDTYSILNFISNIDKKI